MMKTSIPSRSDLKGYIDTCPDDITKITLKDLLAKGFSVIINYIMNSLFRRKG